MRYVIGFGRFWYDFVIGDDWRIAAGVIAVLVVGVIALLAGVDGEWLAPVLGLGMVGVFAGPVLRDR